MIGLGLPELIFLVLFFGVPTAVVMVVVSVVRNRRPGFTRFCTSCGRGLTQQADAPLCCYCGIRLL